MAILREPATHIQYEYLESSQKPYFGAPLVEAQREESHKEKAAHSLIYMLITERIRTRRWRYETGWSL